MSLFYRVTTDRRRAFTLIELLVVIGIVAILSAVIVLALNPAQLLRQARDSNRLSDYDTLNRAMGLLAVDTSQTFGVASTTYISIPDPTATSTAGTDCSGVVGLPSLPLSWSYHCAASSTYRTVNGTGWMPVNFGLMSSGAPFGTLPVDPVNTAQSGFFYAYVAGANRYVFTIPLDSEKYLQKGKLTLRDQGTDPTRLESGTDLLLWARATGLSGYWPFDEGSGTTATDASKSGNDGTLLPAVGGPTWTVGKIGGGIQFDGVNDSVDVTDSIPLRLNGDFTISFWYKLNTFVNSFPGILWKGNSGLGGTSYIIYYWEGPATQIRIVFKRANSEYANLNVVTTSWRHYTYTYNSVSGIWKWYVDGVELGTGSVSFSANTDTSQLRMGKADEFGNGTLDETRIYNRALNGPEVKALYNATQ